MVAESVFGFTGCWQILMLSHDMLCDDSLGTETSAPCGLGSLFLLTDTSLKL